MMHLDEARAVLPPVEARGGRSVQCLLSGGHVSPRAPWPYQRASVRFLYLCLARPRALDCHGRAMGGTGGVLRACAALGARRASRRAGTRADPRTPARRAGRVGGPTVKTRSRGRSTRAARRSGARQAGLRGWALPWHTISQAPPRRRRPLPCPPHVSPFAVGRKPHGAKNAGRVAAAPGDAHSPAANATTTTITRHMGISRRRAMRPVARRNG